MSALPFLAVAALAVYFAIKPIGYSMPDAAMKIERVSKRGRDFIKSLEGFSSTAYPDGGYYSIGYGHQIIPGDGLSRYSQLSVSEAATVFDRDIARFELTVFRTVHVPLNQNQFDALVSLCYNVGDAAFTASTLRAKLNRGDYAGAASEFDKWVYSSGRVLPALQRRRAAEKAMFMGA